MTDIQQSQNPKPIQKKNYSTFQIFIVLVILVAFITFMRFRRSQSGTMPADSAAIPLEVSQWITDAPPTLNGPYVLEFWATWCGPCVASIPHVIELAESYPNVPVIALSVDQSPGPVRKMVSEKNINYHVGMAGSMADKYSVRNIPQAFVIDKNNKIIWQGRPAESKMEKAIKKAAE
jgi:thiol-disulfide isomerase/thioredoxin